jgi:site-specific recombinase XerD
VQKNEIRIYTREELIVKKYEQERDPKFRGLSQNTLKTYNLYLKKLMEHAKKIDTDDITLEDIKAYYAYEDSKQRYDGTKLSNATKHMVISALRSYFPDLNIKIKAGKIKNKHKDILTREEIRLLIAKTDDTKYKLLIKVFYATGFRLNEVVNLKWEDINWDEDIIRTTEAKGEKEREVSLALSFKDELMFYKHIKKAKDSDYIFSVAGHQMSRRAVQHAIMVSVENAGIKKNISPHSLRHTFATHQLEDGVDIRKIQLVMGHENISTTARYVKVSTEQIKAIKSPLDKL